MHSPCFICVNIFTLWDHYIHRRQIEDTGRSTSTAGTVDLRVGSRRLDPVTESRGRSYEVGSRRQVQEAKGRTQEHGRERSMGRIRRKDWVRGRQPKHEERGSARRH
jgi:hypothetical protein